MKYLALCCIVKDENQYLSEWIDYHRNIGVEHFYIYDNDSSTPVEQTLAPYRHLGIINISRINGKGQQMPAYEHCLGRYGREARWIGFIDTDEFVVPKGPKDLRYFLSEYEDFGALGVNWLVFGSSCLETKPSSQLRAFTKRAEKSEGINRHIKSFVQCHHVASIGSDPHHFKYKKYYYCVNENKIRVNGPFSPNSTERIQLNHYYLRSQAEWREKMVRGRGDGVGSRSWQEFVDMDRVANAVEDTEILKLMEQGQEKT